MARTGDRSEPPNPTMTPPGSTPGLLQLSSGKNTREVEGTPVIKYKKLESYERGTRQNTMRRVYLLTIVLCCLSGCGKSLSEELTGTWRGPLKEGFDVRVTFHSDGKYTGQGTPTSLMGSVNYGTVKFDGEWKVDGRNVIMRDRSVSTGTLWSSGTPTQESWDVVECSAKRLIYKEQNGRMVELSRD